MADNVGLLSRGAEAPGGDMEATATGPEGEGQEQPNVTPEEQAQYDAFVDNGLKLVYASEESAEAVMGRIAASPNPIEGLASATAMIVVRLKDSAEQKGKQLSPDVMFHGGVEILEDLANTAEKKGIHSFEPKELEAATYKALDLFREIEAKKGGLNQQAIQQDFQGIMQADQQGGLDKVFPGLGEHFKGMEGENAKSG